MNHAEFVNRLAFIKRTLEDDFAIETSVIEPLEYEADFDMPYNNYAYRLELATPAPRANPRRVAPGTSPIPPGNSTFLIRLSNAASGLNQANRVENEVAAMDLARQALRPINLAHVIPDVYGWAPAANGAQGWILMEYKSGINLLSKEITISSLRDDKKHTILSQMAEILGAFQRLLLPESITKFGGLTFNGQGEIVSAEMTIVSGGPFATYEEMQKAFWQSEISEADRNPLINGWKDTDLRSRLDRFADEEIPRIISEYPASERKVLVHGDLTTSNMLLHPETFEVTGLFDFDFSFVGSVADDFLRSLHDQPGPLPGPTSDSHERMFRNALLHGFPDPLPASTEDLDWHVAKIWDDALQEKRIDRPRNIQGIERLSELHWLTTKIAPVRLVNPVLVTRFRSEDAKEALKSKVEGELIDFLTERGL